MSGSKIKYERRRLSQPYCRAGSDIPVLPLFPFHPATTEPGVSAGGRSAIFFSGSAVVAILFKVICLDVNAERSHRLCDHINRTSNHDQPIRSSNPPSLLQGRRNIFGSRNIAAGRHSRRRPPNLIRTRRSRIISVSDDDVVRNRKQYLRDLLHVLVAHHPEYHGDRPTVRIGAGKRGPQRPRSSRIMRYVEYVLWV